MIQCALRTKNKHISAYSALGTDALFLYHDICGVALMFDFKDRYFKYELWNALRLKSANQIRMYEILKQYETIGKREIKVDDLRELLGIAPNEYPRWDRFKDRVIDSCQQALKQFTDICYTYERGKTGTGGKWITT